MWRQRVLAANAGNTTTPLPAPPVRPLVRQDEPAVSSKRSARDRDTGSDWNDDVPVGFAADPSSLGRTLPACPTAPACQQLPSPAFLGHQRPLSCLLNGRMGGSPLVALSPFLVLPAYVACAALHLVSALLAAAPPHEHPPQRSARAHTTGCSRLLVVLVDADPLRRASTAALLSDLLSRFSSGLGGSIGGGGRGPLTAAAGWSESDEVSDNGTGPSISRARAPTALPPLVRCVSPADALCALTTHGSLSVSAQGGADADVCAVMLLPGDPVGTEADAVLTLLLRALQQQRAPEAAAAPGAPAARNGWLTALVIVPECGDAAGAEHFITVIAAAAAVSAASPVAAATATVAVWDGTGSAAVLPPAVPLTVAWPLAGCALLAAAQPTAEPATWSVTQSAAQSVAQSVAQCVVELLAGSHNSAVAASVAAAVADADAARLQQPRPTAAVASMSVRMSGADGAAAAAGATEPNEIAGDVGACADDWDRPIDVTEPGRMVLAGAGVKTPAAAGSVAAISLDSDSEGAGVNESDGDIGVGAVTLTVSDGLHSRAFARRRAHSVFSVRPAQPGTWALTAASLAPVLSAAADALRVRLRCVDDHDAAAGAGAGHWQTVLVSPTQPAVRSAAAPGDSFPVRGDVVAYLPSHADAVACAALLRAAFSNAGVGDFSATGDATGENDWSLTPVVVLLPPDSTAEAGADVVAAAAAKRLDSADAEAWARLRGARVGPDVPRRVVSAFARPRRVYVCGDPLAVLASVPRVAVAVDSGRLPLACAPLTAAAAAAVPVVLVDVAARVDVAVPLSLVHRRALVLAAPAEHTAASSGLYVTLGTLPSAIRADAGAVTGASHGDLTRRGAGPGRGVPSSRDRGFGSSAACALALAGASAAMGEESFEWAGRHQALPALLLTLPAAFSAASNAATSSCGQVTLLGALVSALTPPLSPTLACGLLYAVRAGCAASFAGLAAIVSLASDDAASAVPGSDAHAGGLGSLAVFAPRRVAAAAARARVRAATRRTQQQTRGDSDYDRVRSLSLAGKWALAAVDHVAAAAGTPGAAATVRAAAEARDGALEGACSDFFGLVAVCAEATRQRVRAGAAADKQLGSHTAGAGTKRPRGLGSGSRRAGSGPDSDAGSNTDDSHEADDGGGGAEDDDADDGVFIGSRATATDSAAASRAPAPFSRTASLAAALRQWARSAGLDSRTVARALRRRDSLLRRLRPLAPLAPDAVRRSEVDAVMLALARAHTGSVHAHEAEDDQQARTAAAAEAVDVARAEWPALRSDGLRGSAAGGGGRDNGLLADVCVPSEVWPRVQICWLAGGGWASVARYIGPRRRRASSSPRTGGAAAAQESEEPAYTPVLGDGSAVLFLPAECALAVLVSARRPRPPPPVVGFISLSLDAFGVITTAGATSAQAAPIEGEMIGAFALMRPDLLTAVAPHVFATQTALANGLSGANGLSVPTASGRSQRPLWYEAGH